MRKISCFLLALMMICMCFAGCKQATPPKLQTNLQDELEKLENQTEPMMEYPDETLINFDAFYFEINGVTFHNFETFGTYLSLNPTPWEGHSIENVLNLESCNFKIENGEKYNDFSVIFYDDGTEKNDADVIVSDMYIYQNSDKPLDIVFAQNVKFGDSVDTVLNTYGKPSDEYMDNDKVKTLRYINEEGWIEIEFEFDAFEKIDGFRIRYDYNAYQSSVNECY